MKAETKTKINKFLLISTLTLIGCLIPTIYLCTTIYNAKVIECEISKENVKILRDSIGNQSRRELELEKIIKKICKPGRIENTKTYKERTKK